MFNILNIINKKLVSDVKVDFYRYFYVELEKEVKVIGVVGERGIGKTTALLQFAKNNKNSFYFSADNALIQANSLFKFVFELFNDYEVDNILIDEIHKYDNWTLELKNIIDSFPEKKIIFSGSSSLDIVHGTVNLERRVNILKIYPIDFKEFLKFNYSIDIKKYSFEEIIKNYKSISYELSSIVTNSHIEEYKKVGFYPYSKDFTKEDFYLKIFNTLEKIIIEDLPSFIDSKSSTLIKVKKIFYFIAYSSPGDLNYSSLGKKVGLHSDTLENIIYILSKIGIINLVAKNKGVSNMLRKEFKIYLGNPNLYFAFNEKIDLGIVREAFVLHFLKKLINPKNEFDIDISLPNSGDINFLYNGINYIFEIGGKNKTTKQILGIKNSFVISDDIIIGEGRKIPMWLFGLID